ncbi:CU044_5270 family protein [Microtetraspora malaysiensis]|uniref:CU044_5270 family protein n=1 Tax=Microtetraspora malaysiensis TaxID=161358 RepID=UPI003D90ABF2
MADLVMARLEPTRLDDLAEDAYRRRRSADLARTFETPRVSHRGRGTVSRHRPFLLIAGAAVAGLAAAAIVVPAMVSPDTPPAWPSSTVTHPPATTPMDAHSFLLAAAESAAREPATTGRYWYTLERTIKRVDQSENKTERGDTRKVRTGKGNPLPFTAYVATSQESWMARDAPDRTRTITGVDYKVIFDSPDDEAAWKKMGSPRLGHGPTEPQVNNYDIRMRFMIGSRRLSMDELAKLPTSPAALDKYLRRGYQADANDPENPFQGSYHQYVWGTAHDLLSGPITPGTRAALYQVLADQPGVTMVGNVTDPLGRQGVAVAVKAESRYASDVEGVSQFRLIVAPDTGKLLAYQVMQFGDEPQLSVAYQQMGWTNSLNERP